MTLNELKELCKLKSLKTSGTKEELAKRLENPRRSDLVTTKTIAKIHLDEDSDVLSKVISKLVQNNKSKLLYYSTGHFVYEVKTKELQKLLPI